MSTTEKRFYEYKNANHKKPTMKDVAEIAGVSVSTVSHVLNGTRFVSPDVTFKVKNAIQELKFKANPVARNLRSGKSKLIGFVVSNLENYFYVRIAKGIERVINSLGYHLMLIDSAESKKNEIENVESLYMRGVDGIIVVPTTTDCGYLKTIIPPEFPMVFIDRRPSNYEADSVLLFNAEAAHDAAKHLLNKGHTDVGFVSFHFGEAEIDDTMLERIEGYKTAHEEAGMRVNPDYIQVVPGIPSAIHELRHAESYRITEHLLNTPVKAIVCGNSLAAIGVFTCLKDKSVRIPEDMALITFDDDLWLSMSTPRITAVAQPAESLGSVAVKRLMKRIQGKQLPYECLRLKAEIILRGSC